MDGLMLTGLARLPIHPVALSHFRQNPLQGALKHSLFQGFSRIVSQVPYFLLPFVAGELGVRHTCFMKQDLTFAFRECRIRYNCMGCQEERVVQVSLTMPKRCTAIKMTNFVSIYLSSKEGHLATAEHDD